MEKKIVFLSRATDEFGQLTSEIREAASGAFPNLAIHDQDAPPPGDSGTAEATVEKLDRWIARSHQVYLYVGSEPGSDARIPEQEQNELEAYLSARTNKQLRSLYQFFEDGGVDRSELTYTQLEGVIAFGLQKKPVVLILVQEEPGAASQVAYRAWLRKHLSGYDRIEAPNQFDLRQGTVRRLQTLDKLIALEQLARSASETTLWGLVFQYAQPHAREKLREFSQKIREYARSTVFDWIEHSIELEGNPAPDYIVKGLSGQPDEPTGRWLVPCESTIALLELDSGSMSHRYFPIGERSVWACSFGDDGFCVLFRGDGSYQVGTVDSEISFADVRGFSTQNFEPVRLWKSDAGLRIEYMTMRFELVESARPEDHTYQATRLQTEESEAPRSNVIHQFPLQDSFPFKRGFDGRTFDFRNQRDQMWAVVETKDESIALMRLRPGEFADAFQTVDLSLPGEWECHSAIVDTETEQMVILRVQKGTEAGEVQHIPLFGVSAQADWTYKRKEMPLLSRSDSQVCAIVRADNQGMAPFCFVRRSFRPDVDETILGVWLIPVEFDEPSVQQLYEFACGVKALPPSPIRSLPPTWEDGAPSLDEWWRLLWLCGDR